MLLTEFIKKNENWEQVLSSDPYNLKIVRSRDYILFKYNQISSDFTNPIVQESRGCILRADNFKVVCYPFKKFGNYGESYCPTINWETASVQEKVDGSLIKVWFDGDNVGISTNGTIDAFEAKISDVKCSSFGMLFLEALEKVMSFSKLQELTDKKYTYMFELVSPYTRVVIPYNETKLYFLGCRNNETEQEMMPENSVLSEYFDIPKRYNLHTLEDVQSVANELPWDEEGYVVCDSNFNRVKIKSPEYVKAHYARTTRALNLKALIDVILRGEVEEFIIYASDYKDDIANISKTMENFKTKVNEIRSYCCEGNFESRKDFAMAVQQHPKFIQQFLYANDVEEVYSKLTPEKWECILINQIFNYGE